MDLIKEINKFVDADSLKDQDGGPFGEVFERNAYQLSPEDIRGLNVLDIGANIGCFSLYCAILGAKKVLSVEPHPDTFTQLVGNTRNCPAIVSAQYAVGSGVGKMYMHGEGTSATTSAKPSGSEVRVLGLSDLLDGWNEYFGGDHEIVAKIDCEGAEYDLLFSASKRIIRRFKTIFIEIHKHTDEPKDALLSYLLFLGFELVWKQPFCTWDWGPDGSMLNFRVLEGTETFRLKRI